MRNKLLEDLKNAMKAQDKETLSVLRMVKGAIQLEEINLKKHYKFHFPSKYHLLRCLKLKYSISY